MIFGLCVALFFICFSLLQIHERRAWRDERKELIRRIAEPQQVIVENALKREKPERVWTDEQYKKLMESRGQIPVDN